MVPPQQLPQIRKMIHIINTEDKDINFAEKIYSNLQGYS